jgi:hypothetical protein
MPFQATDFPIQEFHDGDHHLTHHHHHHHHHPSLGKTTSTIMGLRAPPIGTPNGRNSSNSMLPGMRKRSRSGSPSFLFPSNFPNSRRLSQATLHKIFIGMMATAFSLYVLFTAYLIRHHHTMEREGNNGETWRLGLQDQDEILRAHIQRLRDLQQQQLPHLQDAAHQEEASPMVADSIVKTIGKMMGDDAYQSVSSDRHSQPIKKQNHREIVSLTLEEVDIHDMKHPKEVHKQLMNSTIRTRDIVASVQTSPGFRVLKAYLEPIYLPDWDVKPLPVRNITIDQLQVIEYPRVNSCQRLPELWPVDDFPDADPFLP